LFCEAARTKAIGIAFAERGERFAVERYGFAPAAALRRGAFEGFAAGRADFAFRHAAIIACKRWCWANVAGKAESKAIKSAHRETPAKFAGNGGRYESKFNGTYEKRAG